MLEHVCLKARMLRRESEVPMVFSGCVVCIPQIIPRPLLVPTCIPDAYESPSNFSLDQPVLTPCGDLLQTPQTSEVYCCWEQLQLHFVSAT